METKLSIAPFFTFIFIFFAFSNAFDLDLKTLRHGDCSGLPNANISAAFISDYNWYYMNLKKPDALTLKDSDAGNTTLGNVNKSIGGKEVSALLYFSLKHGKDGIDEDINGSTVKISAGLIVKFVGDLNHANVACFFKLDSSDKWEAIQTDYLGNKLNQILRMVGFITNLNVREIILDLDAIRNGGYCLDSNLATGTKSSGDYLYYLVKPIEGKITWIFDSFTGNETYSLSPVNSELRNFGASMLLYFHSKPEEVNSKQERALEGLVFKVYTKDVTQDYSQFRYYIKLKQEWVRIPNNDFADKVKEALHFLDSIEVTRGADRESNSQTESQNTNLSANQTESQTTTKPTNLSASLDLEVVRSEVYQQGLDISHSTSNGYEVYFIGGKVNSVMDTRFQLNTFDPVNEWLKSVDSTAIAYLVLRDNGKPFEQEEGRIVEALILTSGKASDCYVRFGGRRDMQYLPWAHVGNNLKAFLRELDVPGPEPADKADNETPNTLSLDLKGLRDGVTYKGLETKVIRTQFYDWYYAEAKSVVVSQLFDTTYKNDSIWEIKGNQAFNNLIYFHVNRDVKAHINGVFMQISGICKVVFRKDGGLEEMRGNTGYKYMIKGDGWWIQVDDAVYIKSIDLISVDTVALAKPKVAEAKPKVAEAKPKVAEAKPKVEETPVAKAEETDYEDWYNSEYSVGEYGNLDDGNLDDGEGYITDEEDVDETDNAEAASKAVTRVAYKVFRGKVKEEETEVTHPFAPTFLLCLSGFAVGACIFSIPIFGYRMYKRSRRA